MPFHVIVGMGAFFAVSLVIGVRLVVLGVRTGGRPELLVAAGLLGIGPLGYTPAVIGTALVAQGRPSGAVWVAVGAAMMALGGASAAVFTCTVFRSGSFFARTAAALLTASFFGAWLATGLETGFHVSTGHYATGSYVSMMLRVLALAWSSAESLAYWTLMRRRLALGLADPVITNRFWLWGVGIGFAAGANVIGLLTLLSADPFRYYNWMSGIGMVCAVTLGLAFLPPARYRSWIERRALAQRSDEGRAAATR